ncbi:hypothetical protein BOX15_Mlig015045g1, partial [Macrostomum lignano]
LCCQLVQMNRLHRLLLPSLLQRHHRRAYGILDTPEQKTVYPSFKRLLDAATSASQQSDKDQQSTEDSDSAEPSNRLLDAVQRYDSEFRKSVKETAALVATAMSSDSVTAAVLESAKSAGLVAESGAERSISLSSDPSKKFLFLSDCVRRLNRPIPNSLLSEIATVGDAVDYFLQPAELPKDPLKRLAMSDDLPPNVHVQIDPLRFTDNPEFFDGVDAYPGRDTLVTQPWARAKYRSKIAPPLRSPRWTGVGRNPGSLSDMVNKS